VKIAGLQKGSTFHTQEATKARGECHLILFRYTNMLPDDPNVQISPQAVFFVLADRISLEG